MGQGDVGHARGRECLEGGQEALHGEVGLTISRREFIGVSAALVASGVLPRELTARQTVRVLVVGAGAAGLTAAYELQRAGHEVKVFEARDRPGGRMYTIREPFSGGLHAEAGAMYLSENNPGLEYARELGLELRTPTFDFDRASLYHVAGQRLVARGGEPVDWPLPLDADERGLSLFQLESRYFRTPVGSMPAVERLETGASLGPEALALDERSVGDLLDETGASAGARRLLGLGYYEPYLNEPAPVSVLQIALERGSFRGSNSSFQVVGGNDRICSELAARLGEVVEYRTAVRAVRQDSAGVWLAVEGSNGVETIEGDFVVLTPPPPVLRDLIFEPALDPTVMRSLGEIHPVPATRVFVEARSRFWEPLGFNGSAGTDGPLGSISHSTAGQAGQGGILNSFTYGQRARSMAARPPEERLGLLREGLETLYPGATDLSDRGTSHAWGSDPWARCGFVNFLPGQLSEFLGALRRPQGRVYLAGDTVGGVSGYSHAAFASGRSVAAQIVDAA